MRLPSVIRVNGKKYVRRDVLVPEPPGETPGRKVKVITTFWSPQIVDILIDDAFELLSKGVLKRGPFTNAFYITEPVTATKLDAFEEKVLMAKRSRVWNIK